MHSTELARIVLDALEDSKASDIKILNSGCMGSIIDFMIVASGRSSRQLISIGETVIAAAKKHHVQLLGVEGKKNVGWVLIDFGDITVHIMDYATREHYQLEELWPSAGKLKQQTLH